MATFHDPKALAAKQIERARKFRAEVRTEHQQMANRLYEEADKMLSGTLSRKDEAELGYPFGRNKSATGKPGRQRGMLHTRTRMPTLPINDQTGKLRSALRLTKEATGTIQSFLLNVSQNGIRYAKYILAIGGTDKMVTRPFFAAIQKSWKQKNFDLLVKMRTKQRQQ